jgi:hypothetical protein
MRTWIVSGILCCAILAAADTKKEISGTWKLNTSKSDFGPLPAPNSVVTTIKHEEPKLELSSNVSGAQGEYTTSYKYTTDGKECTNVNRGIEAKSTVTWEGDTLLINSKVNANGNDIVLKDKYVTSSEGKVLTLSRHITAPQGELDQTYVYDKQ